MASCPCSFVSSPVFSLSYNQLATEIEQDSNLLDLDLVLVPEEFQSPMTPVLHPRPPPPLPLISLRPRSSL